MSDFSIPGVTSKYDTQKLIEDLMKVERIPKTREEERLKAIELERTAWLDLNRRLTSLREVARRLYSYQNPFSERIAESSDESVLGASATREAIEETRSFVVKQTASADRFMSNQLPSDYKIPAGDYTFTVGDKTVKLSYAGGSLKDFADALNRKGGTIVRAQVVNATSDTRILVVESLMQGSANRLGFAGAAEKLALDAGIIVPGTGSRRDLPVEQAGKFEKAYEASKIVATGGSLSVAPGAETALRFASAVPSAGLVMELEIEVQDLGQAPQELPPSGPVVPGIGGITYEDITIQSAPSDPAAPAWTPPAPVPRVDDPKILYLIDASGKAIALPAVDTSPGWKKISIPIAAYADAVMGLGVRNGNTRRQIQIRSVSVFDPTETAGYKPKSPIDTARDAIIRMDGIEVTRSSNTVSDLLPGVTLDLRQASDKPVKLSIKPDREAAKEGIIELVGNYNRLMAELNIVSRSEESILSEIDYLSTEERATYKERLGMFQGDSMIGQMRSSLQRIMMDVYGTDQGPKILATFGVSTNTSRASGGYDASRLRGYLEIDESALDKALLDSFQSVRQAFGFDSDRDLIVDSGIGFALDALMKPYVETGGIISTRTRTLDDQIARQKRTIETLDKQLAKKEEELKRKYGLMEGALGQMEGSSKAWESFGSGGD